MPESTSGSRRTFLRLGAAAAVGVGLAGCGSSDHTVAAGTPAPTVAETPVANGEDALRLLVDGNERYASDHPTDLNEGPGRRVAVSRGQHPFATILSCVDSRVPPELVFDRGLGDLVVVRSAGEVLDEAVTGSLEFGVAELETPVLMVLGHQRCGAVGATIEAIKDDSDDEGEGSIGYLVEALTPAVRQVAGKPGDQLTNAVKANVALVLAQLRKSPVLGRADRDGDVLLVGGYYDLETGLVSVLRA